MLKKILITLILFGNVQTFAVSHIYKTSTTQPFPFALHSLKDALGEQHFAVVYKSNILRSLEKVKDKIGKTYYNKKHFEQIRSIILCDLAYANDIINTSPDMMVFCPIKIVLMKREKEEKTVALLFLPSQITKDSTSKKLMEAVEKRLKQALHDAEFQ